MKKLKRTAAFFLAIIIMASGIPYRESRAEEPDGTNTPGVFRVDVVDEYGSRLAGAGFEIMKEEDYSTVFSWTSDGINEQSITLAPGLYVITQTIVPPGKMQSVSIYFEVEENGAVSMYGTEVADNRIEIVNQKLVLDIDPPMLSVLFETIDSDGRNLTGAEVRVTSADGTVIDTWISEEYGCGLVLEEGDYYFEMVNPPAGYMKADPIPFTVVAEYDFEMPRSGVKWDSSEAYLANYFKTVAKRCTAAAIEWEEEAETKAALTRLFEKYNTRWDALIDAAAADYFEDTSSGELDDGPQKVPSEFLRQIYDAMKQDIEEELRIAEEGTPAYDAASCIRQNLEMDYEFYIWQMDGGLSNGVSMVNYKAPVGPGGSTAKIDLTVTKTWEDENNRFKLRPDEVVVELLADTGDGPELTGQTLTLTENTWKDDFSGLPTYEYENGVPVRKIAYTVREVSVEHYTSTIAYEGEDAVSIKNRLVTYPVAISKQNDGDASIAGAELQIRNAADEPVTEVWESDTSDKILNLPAGTYKLHEIKAPIGYDKGSDVTFTIEANGQIKIRGTVVQKVVLHNTESRMVLPVKKTWEDEDDRFKLRPDTVTVNLLADKGNGPEQTGQTLQLSEGGNWEDAFSHLPVYNYDADGKATEKIIYTIEEEPIEHYTEEITYKGDGGAEIKNKLVTYPVVISKQNEENENLAGAVLQIFDAGNNPVTERWVSGQTDKTIQLPAGTYRLHEEAPPIGYKKADDLFFTVEGNGIIKVNNANVEKVVLKNYRQSPQGLGIGGERVFSKLLLLLLALGIIRLLFRDEKRRKEE